MSNDIHAEPNTPKRFFSEFFKKSEKNLRQEVQKDWDLCKGFLPEERRNKIQKLLLDPNATASQLKSCKEEMRVALGAANFFLN